MHWGRELAQGQSDPFFQEVQGLEIYAGAMIVFVIQS